MAASMLPFHSSSSFLTAFCVGRILTFSVAMLVIPPWFVRITLIKSFDCDADILKVTSWVPDFVVFRRITSSLGSVLKVFLAL